MLFDRQPNVAAPASTMAYSTHLAGSIAARYFIVLGYFGNSLRCEAPGLHVLPPHSLLSFWVTWVLLLRQLLNRLLEFRPHVQVRHANVCPTPATTEVSD
eukprot:m.395443 g.395443  ORF g.395443 m.395443 type:complete len:100 (-) comp16770_c2_seq12:17252-17551(-)